MNPHQSQPNKNTKTNTHSRSYSQTSWQYFYTTQPPFQYDAASKSVTQNASYQYYDSHDSYTSNYTNYTNSNNNSNNVENAFNSNNNRNNTSNGNNANNVNYTNSNGNNVSNVGVSEKTLEIFGSKGEKSFLSSLQERDLLKRKLAIESNQLELGMNDLKSSNTSFGDFPQRRHSVSGKPRMPLPPPPKFDTSFSNIGSNTNSSSSSSSSSNNDQFFDKIGPFEWVFHNYTQPVTNMAGYLEVPIKMEASLPVRFVVNAYKWFDDEMKKLGPNFSKNISYTINNLDDYKFKSITFTISKLHVKDAKYAVQRIGQALATFAHFN